MLEDTSRYHASTLPTATPTVLRQLLSWPTERAFPSADLLRAVLLHPGVNSAVGPADMQELLASAFRGGASHAPVLPPFPSLCAQAARSPPPPPPPTDADPRVRQPPRRRQRGPLSCWHSALLQTPSSTTAHGKLF